MNRWGGGGGGRKRKEKGTKNGAADRRERMRKFSVSDARMPQANKSCLELTDALLTTMGSGLLTDRTQPMGFWKNTVNRFVRFPRLIFCYFRLAGNERPTRRGKSGRRTRRKRGNPRGKSGGGVRLPRGIGRQWMGRLTPIRPGRPQARRQACRRSFWCPAIWAARTAAATTENRPTARVGRSTPVNHTLCLQSLYRHRLALA